MANQLTGINAQVLKTPPYIIPPSKTGYVNLSVIQSFVQHPADVLAMANTIVDIRQYPSLEKHAELIELIHRHLWDDPKDDASVVLTAGSGAGLVLILRTFCDIDSKIVIASPNYPGFVHDAELMSTNVCNIPVSSQEDLFSDTFKDIAVDARMVYLSSPSIPLGYKLDTKVIELIKSMPSVLWVIDEAYAEWLSSEDQNSLVSHVAQLDNLIITRTFSKVFGAAGIRLGYIATTPTLASYLSVHRCTKSIPEYSINFGIAIMKNREYYLDAGKNDIKRWHLWINYIRDTLGWEVSWSGFTPFCLIKCSDATTVCEIMETNGILVRNKSADLGYECIRVCLADDIILDKVSVVLRRISAIQLIDFTDVYIDLDKTIRDSYCSDISNDLVEMLNEVNSKVRLHIVSDNRYSTAKIELYLARMGVQYFELECPMKKYNLVLTDKQQNDGYLVANDCVYVFKFPVITPSLMREINRIKLVRVIELDDWEDSFESYCISPSFDIPFVGKFISMLSKNIAVEIIGKESARIPTDITAGLMIGDSNADRAFARNNKLAFKHVSCPTDTLAFLRKLV